MTQKVVANDEAVTGSKIFFAIFCTFGRYVTNLRDTHHIAQPPKDCPMIFDELYFRLILIAEKI
jgi:hypothetical protein